MAKSSELDGKKWVFLGATFSAQQERKCDRCEYPIKYFFALQEANTDNKVVVGSECVKILTGKTVAENTKDMKDQKRKAETERIARIRMQELEDFRAEHKAKFDHFFELQKYVIENKLDHEFLLSLGQYFEKFDTLTIKQLEATQKITLASLEQFKNNQARASEIQNILADLMLCRLGRFDEDFFKSLQSQYNVKGWLSEKQYICLLKMHARYKKQIEARVQQQKIRYYNEMLANLGEIKERAKGLYEGLKKDRAARELASGRPSGLNRKWYQYWNAVREMVLVGNLYRDSVSKVYPSRPYIHSEVHRRMFDYVIKQMEIGGEHIDALNAAMGTHWNNARKNLINNHSIMELARMLNLNGLTCIECATCSNQRLIAIEDLENPEIKKHFAIVRSRIKGQEGQLHAYFVCPDCFMEWKK